jgi:hypothetical protein
VFNKVVATEISCWPVELLLGCSRSTSKIVTCRDRYAASAAQSLTGSNAGLSLGSNALRQQAVRSALARLLAASGILLALGHPADRPKLTTHLAVDDCLEIGEAGVRCRIQRTLKQYGPSDLAQR